ncbi:30S ribosomal protein S2 [Candidatus Geothermarchaeota archaeon]|nr:MAG: 30S ribosomal protein S2 [Candidatus Geothermarchaeota archaeon]RLG62078.1 MAG: 30S ribosomal protein S2 [Candidatus Geothermarchaeota archaeon]HEW93358.1 30S ribosomal protein S2 [Thermoprotei archaeon]
MSEEAGEVIEINKDFLLKYRVHYGRNIKTPFSEEFIYAIHPKGFYLIDLDKTLEKLRIAAKMLSRYDPSEVMVHSAREFARKGIEEMCKLTGFQGVTGRFLPGTLTNYMLKYSKSISLLIVIDHTYDRQAVDEAVKMRIPIISFVDTNSDGSYVDLAIPANNKGKYSIAALLWSLTILVLREKGLLGPNEFIEASVEDFMVSPEYE